MGLAAIPAGTAAAGAPASVSVCALGSPSPGLGSAYQSLLSTATARYAATLGADSAATRKSAEATFAAAAAAYVYGMPQEILLQTIKGYIHNEIVNVNALATPSTQGVVSPNVDTAYSVAWIDLTTGPVVINVPDTDGRFYTFQFMDAYTNAFAYVGSGSTGTQAGAYAIVPPGWSGPLPVGVQKIQSPTNTVWLLGRTLVDGPSDFPAVKQIQEKYTLTPLSVWEAGVRDPSLTIASYPSGKKKVLPTGTAFIATLNQELTIDPPPAADDCAVGALAPAGVVLPHPTAAQTSAADLANIAGQTPAIHEDAVTTAAIDAGVSAGPELVSAAASRLDGAAAAGHHGWAILNHSIGVYGTQYLARAVVATDYLGANIPSQGMYPAAYVDVAGRSLSGDGQYSITFPRGLLPPARAFWSLTMYDSDNDLYANQLNRYAIGNRTSGLVYGRNGSLTLDLQHAQPSSAAARANWLPSPSGSFHVILRLYQPTAAALDERWTPPPLFDAGETLSPLLTRVGVSGTRLSYRDDQPASAVVTVTRAGTGRVTGGRVVARVRHRDRAGVNRIGLGALHLAAGRYRVSVRATGAPDTYDNAPSRPVTVGLTIG